MPFYIKKSISAGPFRFNFSKGGTGVSVGVKGLRIGTGPRGHYIHAGRGGLYYRASLGNAGKPQARLAQTQPAPRIASEQDGVTMIEIDSGDVMQMRDGSFSELLDEINAKSQQTSMAVALFWMPLILAATAAFVLGRPALLFGVLAFPGWALGRWLDSYRRSAVLFYDLEGDAEAAYKALIEGFDGLRQCAGKWHIEAGGAITNLAAWKRNAGASHLVKKKPTSLVYSLPSVIKSNINPPALSVGKQVMYFMPDVVLVQDGKKVGGVNYRDLNIRWQDSRFIEDGRVPRDAQVVGHTWQHPNKNGGPDRRFKHNRQIPICLYETMHLQSASGVHELVEFSKTGKVGDFASGCRSIAQLPKTRTQPPPTPAAALPVPEPQTQLPALERRRGPLRAVALFALVLLMGLPVVAMLLPIKPETASTAPNGDDVQTGPAAETPPFPTNQNDVSPTPTALPAATSNQRVTAEIPAAAPPNDLAADDGQGTGSATALTAERPRWRTQTAVNLRVGPSTKYPVLAVIPKDTQIVLVEQSGGWSHVKADKGMVGWMTTKAIAEYYAE